MLTFWTNICLIKGSIAIATEESRKKSADNQTSRNYLTRAKSSIEEEK